MKLEEWMNYQIGQISVGKILSALLLLCVCLAAAKLLMKLVTLVTSSSLGVDKVKGYTVITK